MKVLFLKGGSFGIPENSFKKSLNTINKAIKKFEISTVIWDGDPLPVVEYKKDLGFANLLPFIKQENPTVSMITFKGAKNKAAVKEKISELSNPNNLYRDNDEEPFKQGYSFFKKNTSTVNIIGNQNIAGVPDLNARKLRQITKAITEQKNAIVITPKFYWKELGLNIMKIMKNLGLENAYLANVGGGNVVKEEEKARAIDPNKYPIITNIKLDKFERQYFDVMRRHTPKCDMYCSKTRKPRSRKPRSRKPRTRKHK